jgi:hypothetical protein
MERPDVRSRNDPNGYLHYVGVDLARWSFGDTGSACRFDYAIAIIAKKTGADRFARNESHCAVFHRCLNREYYYESR